KQRLGEIEPVHLLIDGGERMLRLKNLGVVLATATARKLDHLLAERLSLRRVAHYTTKRCEIIQRIPKGGVFLAECDAQNIDHLAKERHGLIVVTLGLLNAPQDL